MPGAKQKSRNNRCNMMRTQGLIEADGSSINACSLHKDALRERTFAAVKK
jgi:hypothetical protein